MTVYLRGGKWYWYRRQIKGRDYRITLRLRKGQEGLLSARVKQVDDALTARSLGLKPPAGGDMLFSEYAELYLKRKAYAKTIEQIKTRLEIVASLWPDLPLAYYAPAHIQALEEKLFARGLKGATVNRYAELLRNLWSTAIEDREATENPWRSYKPYAEEGTRRALTDAEVTAILAAAAHRQASPTSTVDRIIYDVILFALATGLRLSEILFLKRAYVRGSTLVTPLAATKSKRRGLSREASRERTIALSPLALDVIAHQPKGGEYVFPFTWRHVNAVSRVIAYIRKATGIENWSFHSFRHTASTFVAGHSSLATARGVLGHADLKTTLRYTHPGEREKQAAVTKLGTHLKKLSRKRLKRNDV